MALSGQKKITAAGTAEALGSQLINGPLLVKALDTNTGIVAIGNVAGDVTVDNGLRLAANAEIYFKFVGNLASLMLDSATNDEGVSWVMLEV